MCVCPDMSGFNGVASLSTTCTGKYTQNFFCLAIVLLCTRPVSDSVLKSGKTVLFVGRGPRAKGRPTNGFEKNIYARVRRYCYENLGRNRFFFYTTKTFSTRSWLRKKFRLFLRRVSRILLLLLLLLLLTSCKISAVEVSLNCSLLIILDSFDTRATCAHAFSSENILYDRGGRGGNRVAICCGIITYCHYRLHYIFYRCYYGENKYYTVFL